jgi:hypothetical protein
MYVYYGCFVFIFTRKKTGARLFRVYQFAIFLSGQNNLFCFKMGENAVIIVLLGGVGARFYWLKPFKDQTSLESRENSTPIKTNRGNSLHNNQVKANSCRQLTRSEGDSNFTPFTKNP